MDGLNLQSLARCQHSQLSCPLAQAARSPLVRGSTPFAESRKPLRNFRGQQQCRAIAEPEAQAKSSVKDENFEIEDFNSKDFKAMFDDLLEKTKTRFDVGDKVNGTVERYSYTHVHI